MPNSHMLTQLSAPFRMKALPTCEGSSDHAPPQHTIRKLEDDVETPAPQKKGAPGGQSPLTEEPHPLKEAGTVGQGVRLQMSLRFQRPQSR